MNRKIWLVYVLVGTLVLAAFLSVPVLRVGPLFNLIGLSGAIVIITAMREHRPGRRLPWLLVAIGQILFVAGDVITYNYVRFFGTDPPFPSIGDLFYLSVYPFLVAGILLLVRHRSPGKDQASLIDSLIVGIGVGTISWVFLILPYVQDATLTLTEKLVAMAYPLMDLILVTAAVRLAVGSGRRTAAFHLMMGSIAVLFITDIVYGWIVLHGGYDNTTGFLEGGWGLFYLLWGAAALHPSTHMFDEPAVENGHEPKQSRRRLLVLAAASLLAPTVTFIISISVQTRVTAAAAAITFALVLIRLNGLMVDINEYRRTARALGAAETKYRSLVEGLPAIVYIADFGEDGDFTYISPKIESILGFTQNEFTAASVWRQRIFHEDRDVAVSAEMGVFSGGGRLQCEYRIVGKDGELVWIREEADAVRDELGKPIYLQGVMYDITAQKRVEEQLVKALEAEQETNRIRSEFVLMINHELRTPLTSVVTGAELLRHDALSPDDRHALVEDMVRDGNRLDGLISQMLTVARVENRGLSYTLRRTTIKNVLEKMRRAVDKGSLAIEADEVESEAVHTDPQALIQLLLSLADNAYTHGARTVSIKIVRSLPFLPMQSVGTEPDPALYFLVQDDGPGIDEEFLPRAFEKFEKHSRSSGTGLGLYLARLMAEAIEGSIHVHTGQEGSIMAVAVPLLPNHSRVAALDGGSNGVDGARPKLHQPKREKSLT